MLKTEQDLAPGGAGQAEDRTPRLAPEGRREGIVEGGRLGQLSPVGDPSGGAVKGGVGDALMAISETPACGVGGALVPVETDE